MTSQPVDRRQFIQLAGAAALSGLMAPGAAQARAAPLTSDVARLRRVLVNPPSVNDLTVYAAGGEIVQNWLAVAPEAVAGHREMVSLLRRSGAEVLILEDVLDAAIMQARKRGAFEAWLSATHPRLSADPARVTAAALLNRDPALQFQHDADGNYRHLQDPLLGSWYIRDAAVMTPRGLVLCNFLNPHRQREAVLFRFAREFAPQLRDYPVAFDAAQAGYYAEGGDFQVIDDHTLFLGVGNRTDPRVAALLAQRLEMDVVAVQTQKIEWLKRPKEPDALRGVFLHLDTYFTHIAANQVLTLPWMFESAYAGKDPLTSFISGIRSEQDFDDDKARKAMDFVRDIGTVRRFQAGSGAEVKGEEGEKIVDYVRARGYKVHYVGGAPPPEPDLAHWFRVVYPEHERQGANVVATGPGEILAYAGATRTHAALRAAGIRVDTFDGRELWRGNGGPHCLTLPLERG